MLLLLLPHVEIETSLLLVHTFTRVCSWLEVYLCFLCPSSRSSSLTLKFSLEGYLLLTQLHSEDDWLDFFCCRSKPSCWPFLEDHFNPLLLGSSLFVCVSILLAEVITSHFQITLQSRSRHPNCQRWLRDLKTGNWKETSKTSKVAPSMAEPISPSTRQLKFLWRP